MADDPLFWINREHDRTAASDGISRYGTYVRQDSRRFAECWDGTYDDRLAERFAALAWRTATGPVMAPAYADWRSPVLSATLAVDFESGLPGLIATVDVAARWPSGLREARGYAGGRSWSSWKRERSYGSEEYFRAPHEDEVARGGYYALTTMRLVFPFSVGMLPAAPIAGHGKVEEAARQAVAAVVGELNRVVSPVVALERS